MTELAAILGMFGALIFGIGMLIALSAFLNGYVLSILWGWFMVPAFGLPALSVPYAIGVAAVISFITYQYHVDPKEKDAEWWTPILAVFLRPAIVLLFGWCITKFI